jgi:hypothetical protein
MIFGAIKLLGLIIFLYLTWRNLYEDYRDDWLISYGWTSVLIMFLGGKLTYGLLNWNKLNLTFSGLWRFWEIPGTNLWGGLLLILLWTWWLCKKNEWKLWPFLEDLTPIYYLFVAFELGENYLRTGLDWRPLGLMIVAILGYLMSSLLRGKYRSFSWYKSGKKGFIFFFTNAVVALFMSIIAFWFKDGWIVTISYLSVSLIFGLGLVILGELFNNLFVGKKVNG